MYANRRIHWIARVFCMVALILVLATLPAKATSDPETWSLTDSMSTAREGHTAILLGDGRVLVAGGFNGLYPTDTELYDPATETWTTTGLLYKGRRYHAATLLSDGRVLVSGGRLYIGNDEYEFLKSTEIYDPETGTWTSTGDMNTGRQYHTQTLLNDGRVLVAGGYQGTPYFDFFETAELYDPDAGTWITTTVSMHEKRSGHTATLLLDGRVLVAGGSNGMVDHMSAELYDPETDTWTLTGSMHTGRRNHTATRLSDGQVLVAAGFDVSSAEVYNPTTGTWTPTGSMSTDRQNHTATRLSDGRVLVAGGYSDGSDDYLDSAEIYDPATGIWTLTNPMNDTRRWHTATLLPDGRVLVAGGFYDYSNYHASAELYFPSVINRPPDANADAYTTLENTTLEVPTVSGVLSNDTDPEGGSLTATLESLPNHGTVTLQPDGSFVYTPTLDYSGLDGFTYQACDDAEPSGCSAAAVTITVSATPINLPPAANTDAYATLENTTLQVPAASGVLANDSDPDGDPLTATLDSTTDHGTVTLQPNGSFVYTPTVDYLGSDGFTYQACDDAEPRGCDTAAVNIVVKSVEKIVYLPVVLTGTQTIQ